ncbi:MAG TPA: hypothetical protein VFF31_13970 [Blastocatellia bacterium]|nr:hypothetical protein [Blastocatellia bacterium]
MRPRSTLAYALSLSLLVSLVGFTSTAHAQQGLKPVAHTGILWRRDDGSTFRLTVLGTGGNDTIRVSFGWQIFGEQTCNSEGVCGYSIVSQGRTAPVILNNGAVVSFDAPAIEGGARLVVFTNNQKVRLTGQIIGSTSEVTGFFDLFFSDLDD